MPKLPKDKEVTIPARPERVYDQAIIDNVDVSRHKNPDGSDRLVATVRYLPGLMLPDGTVEGAVGPEAQRQFFTFDLDAEMANRPKLAKAVEDILQSFEKMLANEPEEAPPAAPKVTAPRKRK